MPDDEDLVSVTLGASGRRLMVDALNQWGGPAYGTGQLALVLGHATVEDTRADVGDLQARIEAGRPMTSAEWTRALVATELSFVSVLLGAAGEWQTIHGTDERRDFDTLRGVQRRLSSVVDRAHLAGTQEW